MIGKKFEEQVEQTPHHTAVKTGNQWVTYEQLNRYSNRVAWLILKHLGHTGSVERVSLLFDHGLHMITAILGAFKAGMAYVPLSTDYPENRLSYMVGNSGSLLILALSCHEVTARTIAQNNNIKCLFIDEPGDRFSEENPGLDVPGSQLAYIMYTSGSTGRPKGVMQTHENVLYYIRNWVKIFSITSSDCMTLFSSFCHDGSVQDLLAALLTGAGLFPLNMRDRESTVELSDFLVRERITIWHSVPSLYSYFVNTLTGKEKFPYLRCVLLGGETVRQHDIIMFKRFFPQSLLANVYGQTESSVNSIRLIHQENVIEHMTIGDPLDRTQVLVLDEDDSEVEEFEVGEIMVACQHLSTGYWKNPEETKRIFSYDPEMGSLYFTGDLGRLLPGGEIEFLGRRDFQVKIRGFRIEMGEIESQVLKHPGTHEAVVTVRENEEGEKELCCYYIPRISQAQRETGGDVEKPGDLELREFLAGELPDYMIPTYFVPLERFPLTQSGKIDRSALPAPKAAEITYAGPGDELEKTLVNLWCTVLCKDADQVGIDANFFQLGGHSLKATALVSKIHKTLDIRVPVVQIFKTPTIRGLAVYIKSVREDKFISIEPATLKEYYLLSSAQKRLYILQQMDETGIGYNMPGVFLLEGDLEEAKLEGAFKRLIERHESLRTWFDMIEEEPVQRVQKKINYTQITNKNSQYPSVSLPGNEKFLEVQEPFFKKVHGSRRQIDIDLDEIIKDFVRPFDLSKAPLLRAGLMEFEPGKHLLMTDMHHIISDGISFIIMLRDLLAFYSGKSLAPLRVQYKDYCQWQLGSREMEIRQKQADFWINTFSKEIPVLNLPGDFPRPAVQRFEGSRQGFTLDKEVTRRLKEVALSGEATLFMILLALFNAFLSKITGQEDIAAGTVVSGRDHSELQPIVGMFVNTLALRNYPCEEKAFSQFLKEVKTTALAAFENRSYPFEDLVEQVTIKRDISRNPIFDVMFRLQNFDVEGEEEEITELESEEGLRLKPWDFNKTTSPFDLTLIGVELEAHLYFKMEYSTNLFKEETISRFIGYFKRIAASASKNPYGKLSQLEIMEEEEKQRILYEFNDTALEYPAEKTIHQLFEEQVQRTPDHIAVVGAHQLHELHEEGTRGLAPLFIPISITYRKLSEQSDQLAYLLRHKGVGPDILVGLMVERSVEMIIGLLGILKAGGAYMPIDPGYPLTRMEYIIKTSGAAFFLTSGTGTDKLEKISYNGSQLDLFELSLNKTNTGKKENPGDIVSPPDLAYVIYTSGSTGNPKGVMIRHRNVVNFIFAMTAKIDFAAGKRILALTTISFDIFLLETLLPLTIGMTVVVTDEEHQKDFSLLEAIIMRQQIDILQVTPSRLKLLMSSDETPYCLTNVRQLLVGGEAFPGHLSEPLLGSFQGCLYNVYGPTETTVWSTIKPLTTDETVTIGKPIANTYIYILHCNKQVRPIGIAGELLIGGDGVARGYLNNPELTLQKFIEQVPGAGARCRWINQKFLRGIVRKAQSAGRKADNTIGAVGAVRHAPCAMRLPPGRRRQKIYKTGDLARWLSNGEIEFLGRMDYQVKIRGFRIELEEIEEQLLAHEQIKEAVVLARPDSRGENSLCAYIVPQSPSNSVPVSQFIEYLSVRLPHYMIPSYFVFLEGLPLTPNGKIDRKALPEPTVEGGEIYAAPRTLVEEKLVETWSQVLGIPGGNIGIDDNFFQLGGHSLKATRMISKIHKTLQVRLQLTRIFQAPTIRGLASYIRGQEKEQYLGIPLAEKKEYYPLSPMQERFFILSRMDGVDTAFNLRQVLVVKGKLEFQRLEKAFQLLIQRHESLRTSFEVVEEEPVQRVYQYETLEFEIEYHIAERRAQSAERKEERHAPCAMRCASAVKDFIRPFDLSRLPLLRVGLVELEQNKHLLMIETHHIVSDGTSMGILLREFIHFYEGKNLPQLTIQYKDCSQWQTNGPGRAIIQGQEAWWLEQFKKQPPKAELFTDYPRPRIQSFEGDRIRFTLEKKLSQKLYQLVRDTGTTLYMVLLAAFNILLSRYTSEEDIIIGTPTAGRQYVELENAVGVFINALPMRNYPVGNKSLREFLAEIKENTLKAYENQEYPFARLIEKLKIKSDGNRNPLFDVDLVVQNMEFPQLKTEKGELTFIPAVYDSKIAQVDIAFFVSEIEEDIYFNLLYCTKLYKLATMERFVGFFKEILTAMVSSSDIKLKDITISHELSPTGADDYKEMTGDFEF